MASLVTLAPGAAPAAAFSAVAVGSTHATVVRVDPAREHLQLFLDDDHGKPFARLDAVDAWLRRRHRRLGFAMNAGMYEPDRRPVGLFVAEGRTLAPLNTREGSGNFYLKPNGVFFVRADGSAGVVETSRYPGLAGAVALATQSGPLLVERGAIHAAFDPHSRSRKVRNGVGVTAQGTVVFAISDGPVSLYAFAAMFRDTLHCPDALYLDGDISSLFAPALGRDDVRAALGPIIGVVLPIEPSRRRPSASFKPVEPEADLSRSPR